MSTSTLDKTGAVLPPSRIRLERKHPQAGSKRGKRE